MFQHRSVGISGLRLIVGLGVWSLLPSIALAQITPDGSLGAERSQLTRSPVQGAPAELISGGARRGGNLFHSFSEFKVGDRKTSSTYSFRHVTHGYSESECVPSIGFSAFSMS